MTYQIPQQLEYKEKIMFGLTFRQLIYAGIFGSLCILFFRQNLPQAIKIFFIAITALLGTGFIFFDFERHLRDYIDFFKSRKIISVPKRLLQILKIKSIKEDLITLENGKKIAILKIEPINFSIKQPEEKESIMLAFQKFLNSLDFPTQILMNTESLDLSAYTNSLELRIEKKFEKLFKKYKSFLEETISSHKIMNRVFYLIIPEQGNIEIQTNVCIERLCSLNLKVRPLKTEEIESLICKFFPTNLVDDIPQKKRWQFWIKEDPDLKKDSKKIGKQFEIIEMDNQADHLKISNKFYRIIYASGYPRMVEPGFLDRIVSLLGDFNLSLHINPYPIDRMLISLNRELQKQGADLYTMRSKGIFNPSLEIQHNDTRATLEHLQKGQERLFNISLYITCKADSLKDLNLLTKKVEAELNSVMIMPKFCSLSMLQGFQSTLPLGIDELKEYRNLTTTALSAFFPFTSQFLQADDTGVWMGQNKNNIPIIKDIFKLPNPNGVVLAQSGGGKSYFCKLLISRYLLNGTKVIIIDPQGEYKALVKRFGGQIIDLSTDSETLINPLDLMGHDYTQKKLSLMDLIPIMLGELSEPQKAFVDKALTNAYSDSGITMEPETWDNDPPILQDLLKALSDLDETATNVERGTLRSVIHRLDMYVSGVFGFLNKKTNIEFDNRLVCFDISNLPKQVKPSIMYLILDYVYMKMKSDMERKLLVIDEAWTLLSRTQEESYIFEIVKTCRKHNLGLLLINQEVEGLIESKAGRSVLANSAYTLLLRQRPSVIKNICEVFHLSPFEREHLLTANIGEGLLIIGDDHSKIKVIASPEEHDIITTNADEIISKSGGPKKMKSVKVDLKKRFYRSKDLNPDEIKFLLKQGFKQFSQKSLTSNKKEDFILRPRHNESLNHLFLVYDVAEYLRKKNLVANIYTTKMPDIVFKMNGKRYAIEVETGTVAENQNRLKQKIEILKKVSDEWFFIITNRNVVKKYRKFGKTIDPRCVANFLRRLCRKQQNLAGKKRGSK